MPKRKREKDSDNYDYLLKKIKRLEKKLRSPDRHRHYDSPSPAEQATNDSTDTDLLDAWALPDEDVNNTSSAEKYTETDQTDSDSSTASATPVRRHLGPATESPGHATDAAASAPVAGPSAAPVAPVAGPSAAPVAPVAGPSAALVAPVAGPSAAPVAPVAGPSAALVAPVAGPSAAPVAPVVDSPAVSVIEKVDQTVTTDPPAQETEDTLDAEMLEILGTDPTTVKQYGKDIQKDLSVRLEHCATNGLTKELRKEFKDRYLTPDNCKLIDPPEINAEIKAAVSDTVVKRDKAIENKQKQLTSAISCLGEAITLLMSNKDKNTALLKLLIDSTRILCDCQHADTITRRNFLLNAMKKEMKDQLQNTKIDKFLFSENLADTLKSAKAISKSGADLKISAPKPTSQTKKSTPQTSKNLNWKPGPARRQPGPMRTKEPATTSTRYRPMNTSRTSQHQQQRSNRRHR